MEIDFGMKMHSSGLRGIAAPSILHPSPTTPERGYFDPKTLKWKDAKIKTTIYTRVLRLRLK